MCSIYLFILLSEITVCMLHIIIQSNNNQLQFCYGGGPTEIYLHQSRCVQNKRSKVPKVRRAVFCWWRLIERVDVQSNSSPLTHCLWTLHVTDSATVGGAIVVTYLASGFGSDRSRPDRAEAALTMSGRQWITCWPNRDTWEAPPC
jgi:hypothetical protein